MASGLITVNENLVASFTASAIALVTVPAIVRVLAGAARFVAHAASDVLSFLDVAMGVIYPVRGPPGK